MKHGDDIEMTGNYSSSVIPDPGLGVPDVRKDMRNSDENLRREASPVRKERDSLGLVGHVGGLQAVIINTQPHLHKAAAEEQIRYYDRGVNGCGYGARNLQKTRHTTSISEV